MVSVLCRPERSATSRRCRLRLCAILHVSTPRSPQHCCHAHLIAEPSIVLKRSNCPTWLAVELSTATHCTEYLNDLVCVILVSWTTTNKLCSVIQSASSNEAQQAENHCCMRVWRTSVLLVLCSYDALCGRCTDYNLRVLFDPQIDLAHGTTRSVCKLNSGQLFPSASDSPARQQTPRQQRPNRESFDRLPVERSRREQSPSLTFNDHSKDMVLTESRPMIAADK